MTDPTFVRHNQARLAVHCLRAGEGPRLLTLHALGLSTSERVLDLVGRWPGPVHGLDFTGHGASTVPTGGGYSAEILSADVDAALAELGPCTLYGQGLGGYVALLVAGCRPSLVRGAIIDDGPGLAGGSPVPGPPSILSPPTTIVPGRTPDPWALLELSRDVRPPDYAVTMLRLAAMVSGSTEPVAVVARQRPPWLIAVVDDPATLVDDLDAVLARYAASEGSSNP